MVAVCNSNFHNKLIQITINCTLYITQIKPAHILYSYYSKFLDKVIQTIHLYSKSNIKRKDKLFFYIKIFNPLSPWAPLINAKNGKYLSSPRRSLTVLHTGFSPFSLVDPCLGKL